MKKLMKALFGAWCVVLCAGAAFAERLNSDPRLVPDYNRDGVINPLDYEREAAGEPFIIWLNDDDDAEGTDDGAEPGDTNTDLHDVPGGEGNDRDCEDEQVNGRCDLLDFFPVLVDVGRYTQEPSVTWKIRSASVKAVFTGLGAEAAGSFHTTAMNAFGGDDPLYQAPVIKLTEDGVELPAGFLRDGRGVFIVEGAALADGGITLRGEQEGGDPIEVTLDLRVKNVEDMYGWLNLRPKENEAKDEEEGAQWKVENSAVQPSTFNLQPDHRHFILVHGYNTNHEEARGNAAEFYKKLYQSGSDAMFTAVEWRGDQSQMRFDLLGVTFSPNYFVNVENAFAAARPFADACKKLPGEKILVGHSLGNMLVSSAIKDYGLDYTKYVMLNAAVPCEAYNARVYDENMVPGLWKEEEAENRASRWYQNFADCDYRRKLAWRGRFANLPRTVNYYSPTDNLLANPANDDPDDFDETKEGDPKLVRELLEKTISIGGFWAFSEKLKGRPALIETINGVLTNVFGMAESDVYKCEGGWGTNANYNAEATEFDPANTRFTPFLDERLKTQGMPDILPAETEWLRAQHLADAIPAESFAAGANPVATLENVNEEDFIGENPDWPLYEGEEVRTNLWNHSAFREVAFYHTSKFYASLAATGKPRVIIDTDLGSSMDDLFTIDLAARMHKAGKLDLMAVMMDRPDHGDPDGKGEFLTFADRYLASLGFDDLQIGRATGEAAGQKVFNPYWTLIYSNNLTGAGLLLPTNRTPEQIEQLPGAVALYRRLLNDAPDKSVVVCSTGFLTNLKALMESGMDYEGDGIYSTGLELIEQKVKELRIMGGWFDLTTEPADGTHGAEYNFAGDPAAAKKVVEGWPTPVILSPWEVGLKLDYKTPNVLEDFPPGTFDPVVRAAHVYWPEPLGDGDKNRLWDPATILPLTEGEAFLPLSEVGGISVDGFGKTTFVPDPSSNRCYQVASNMNASAVMNRIRAICRTGNPSADTVVYGTIRTAETNNPVAEALAIKDGKYVYVGDEAGVAAFVKDGVTKVIDHRGKGMVMPGCTDGHSHYTLKFSLANIKGGVMFDLNDDKTKVLQKLETAALAAQKAGKTCLYGFGWNFLTLRFGGDQPTLKELDDATHGVSTVIFDQGGHHTFCNSECLKRCGIIDGNGKVLITEIDGGYLELDDKGYPTGYAEERVTGYLTRMGGINYDELVDDEVAEAALRASQELLLSTGCTIALEGWSNTLHPSKFYEAAHRMDTNGTLKLVFPMTYEVEPWQTNMTEQIDYLDSLNKTYRTSHVLPEYLKIFMDGVVETKTGAMLKPYVDDEKTYASFWSTNRLADITRECNGRGLTVHVHTMGDAAVRDTVEAYIQGGDGTHRNCLVHLRNVSTNGVNDFERMAQNNIACTAGFTWHVGTKDDAQMEAFLDKEYVYHAYPMKSFFDAGVRVSSHSDFPANAPSPQDPFGIMEVAVTGQRPDLPADEKCPSYDPDELVTVEQVFQALTLNGAWQLGLENERGSIAVGKWADFVLADQDVFECAATDIGKTKVVSTWFEGEKVYQFVPEPFPVPRIASFRPDFTQGPTTEVPNVSWKIEGPFDRVALTIDKTTVYEGDDRNGEGRWRDLRSPGTHRLLLTVGCGDLEVTASCFYTALLEGEEPALMPMIGYFYPDYYVGKKGTAPLVHWDTLNITSLEIWLDSTCILVTQNASGEFRFSQLDTPGSYVVRMVAHNAIDDAEASFCYRCEAPVQDQLTSAPLLGSVDQPPVIQTFEPDAYDASIRQTPYIRWNISAPVDALKLVIDDIPVFIGDGSTGNGRWLDVSGLKLDELAGSHKVSLSASNSFGVATSNFTCTCYWEEPPPPPKGSEENPWQVGEYVQAYTNGSGALVITGEGATSNFTAAAEVPWAEVAGEIESVTVPDAVTVIGDNLWAGLEENVVINGETIVRRKEIAAGFPVGTPAGAISPAEFERIDIVDGKALLDVSVYTSNTLTNENWSVATNGVIVVPAQGKQGFFYLMSKPSVPSDKPIVPPPLPIEQ